MTDYINLPSDLWREIAKYLSPKDYKALLLTSQFFNTKVAFASSFLQPIYNRLYVLDPSLPVLLPTDNIKATLFFRDAFEKVFTRQKHEAIRLQGGMYSQNNMPEDCLERLHLETATIEQLEENSVILDEVNCKVIRKRIDENIHDTKLNLEDINLTRFPENITTEAVYESYFDKLTELNFSCNYIQNLKLSSLNNLKILDCEVNDVLATLIVPSNLIRLVSSYNKLKVLELSKCDKLEILLCNHNELESISFPKESKTSTLICHNNKLKVLNLSGMTNLTNQNLNFDFNPLEELYLEGTAPFIQHLYDSHQTKLLFAQLLKNFHDADKKQVIIQHLGPRYTYTNCLTHLGFMQTSTIFSEQLLSSYYAVTTFLPSFLSSKKEEKMEIEGTGTPSLKRGREEDDEPGNPLKKRK